MGMTLRQYGAHRGMNHESVRKAIIEGRLVQSVKRKGRMYDIDPELADKEWEENTDSRKDNNQGQRAATPAKSTAPTFNQARAVREMYSARLQQLDYEERSGLLCKVDDVKLAAFKSARLTRDAMLNIPARVVNEIVALLGEIEAAKRHEILQILNREIHSALTQEADSNGLK